MKQGLSFRRRSRTVRGLPSRMLVQRLQSAVEYENLGSSSNLASRSKKPWANSLSTVCIQRSSPGRNSCTLASTCERLSEDSVSAA